VNTDTVSVVEIMLATAWQPKAGETLTGAVVHRVMRTGGEYGNYPIVYMDRNDGNPLVAVHAFHQTLRDGLKELAPTRGQIISIAYAGMKESNKRTDSKGNPVEYHHYAVYDPESSVEGGAFDWSDNDDAGF
jgi:hypothetical protein